MIYDTLENLAQYLGLDPNLDKAIEYLCENGLDPLKNLPLGRSEIGGEDLYINMIETETRPAEKLDFETHSLYADLQLDLSGQELFQVALGELKKKKLYDPDTDSALWKADMSGIGVLAPGRFVLFFPEEAHKPGISGARTEKVRRAVFKIRMEAPEEDDEED